MLFKSLFTLVLALPFASFALPTFSGSGSSIDIAAKRQFSKRGLYLPTLPTLPTLPSLNDLSNCRNKHNAPNGAVPISVLLVQVQAQVKTVCGKLSTATTVDSAAELVGELITIINGAVDKLKALNGASKEYLLLDVDLKGRLTATGIAKLCAPIFQVILQTISKVIIYLNVSLDASASALAPLADAFASLTMTLSGLVPGFLPPLVVQLQSLLQVCNDLKFTSFIQALGVSNTGVSGYASGAGPAPAPAPAPGSGSGSGY